MAGADLAIRIADALATVVAAGERSPCAGAPAALAALFEALSTADSQRERVEAEDLIWALWCSHPDPGLERRMNRAIGAMARRDLGAAQALLDDLVRDAPGWAEAWNKRATLHFLQGRDVASVGDIQRTLELEPRHFGAMGGLGQICLRAGDPQSALIALRAALRLNPNLESLRVAIGALEQAGSERTLH